jgi:hypothetical protein
VPGDYDGDGVAEMALFRASDNTWYIDRVGTRMWGALGDVPVPADYDADGKRDIAVFRPSDGTWYIVYSGTQTGAAFVYGGPGDIPVQATPRNT